ncbi:MAG: phosphoribosylglycinamide formyltransferase [Desulfobacteraceae bacterium]|nr:phosphoribosylglycinamide formyltransferase [Desulfobacteraceae bacterium]MCF8094719.1 phosphoribosylglycinamide formyltransferase [Desulfobacteraceae bacterium]
MASSVRIGALISGSGTNLEAIIEACEKDRINGQVVFAGSDNPEAEGIEKSARHGIPAFVVNYRHIISDWRQTPDDRKLPGDFDLADIRSRQSFFASDADPEKLDRFLCTRAIAEAALLEKMKPYPFDLLVLAGFMRNLSPYFIDRVNTDPKNPRIMNIHPALLPAFAGTDGYGDTFRYGCKVGGCTVHFIDYGEDTGPIIGQRCFTIHETDTLEDVKKRGLAEEWQLYPEAIQLFAQDRLRVVNTTHTLPNGRMYQRRVVKIIQ